jgi:hypothetical protein
MGVRLLILLEAYTKTAWMCLGFVIFFGTIALLAWLLNVKKLNLGIPGRSVFWACMIPGFILTTVCLTLIDRPRWPLDGEIMSWMFMFSAFLGVPVALPLLAGAVWAAACRLLKTPVHVGPLALVMLGVFGLGCAASNIHDVVWCASVTDTYAQHKAAGYDLDFFVALGEKFGIAREVTADYATLGPCAMVMVVGELTVAAACFSRLAKLSAQKV